MTAVNPLILRQARDEKPLYEAMYRYRYMAMHTRILSILTLLICSWTVPQSTTAQVVLYLEQMTEVKAIKIYEGSTISIKTEEEPRWMSYKIDRLLDKDSIILHENGMVHLREITHLRRERRWVRALGVSMQRFGFAYLSYGAIAAVAGEFDMNGSFLAIGIVPIAAGWLMQKIWRHKIYKIGKKNRLKILDLSFPADPYGTKKRIDRV